MANNKRKKGNINQLAIAGEVAVENSTVVQEENTVVLENNESIQENNVVLPQSENSVVENASVDSEVNDNLSGENAIEVIEPIENERVEEESIEDDDYTDKDFNNLALLMNKSVREIKEEVFLNQIYNLMARLSKVVVRYNLSEKEIEQLFKNAKTLKTDGIMVSPAYLSVCKRVKNKNKLTDVKMSSIIDFPFGESTFKTKASAIREGKAYGVEESTVMMPNMLLSEQNIKQFKAQCSRIGWKKAGIALNATDIDEETLKRAVKAFSKTKITHVVFVFGEEPIDVVIEKLNMICANVNGKKVFVLANVDKVETIGELIKLGVEKVLTPYADDIGKDLLNKYKIKSIKIV